MRFQVVIGGKCAIAEKALKQSRALSKMPIFLLYASSREEVLSHFQKNIVSLAILPVDWLDIAEDLRDCRPLARLLAYGKEEMGCSEVIVRGGDDYTSLFAGVEQWMTVLEYEYNLLSKSWRREVNRLAKEKSRNQLIYARIKDSFENTTIDAINRKFHFQFREGLFRAILLRIDYANPGRELFDWFYLLDKTVVAEMTAVLEDICYDVYVEFRMNGPMFYCNYAEEKDGMLYSAMQQLCEEVLNDVALKENLQLSVRMGSAYRAVQNLEKSREEAYKAYRDCFQYDCCRIQIFEKNEHTGIWRSRKIQQLFDMLCAAGIHLDIKEFDRCVEGLKSVDFKVVGNLLPRYVDYFFETNAKLIASYTNPDHARKKMIQAINFSGTKELMIKRFSEQNHAVIGDILRAAPRGLRVIHMTERYVGEHYGEKISVADLAEHLQLNASYFSHLFTKVKGCHFSDYLMDFRMEKAKEFLASTNMSIGEIAELVGYSDQRYFSRMFRRATSKNPTEFRKDAPHMNLNG